MKKRALITGILFAAGLGISVAAEATPISILVGDDDGYGLGVPNNGAGIVWPGAGQDGSNYDGRSAGEKAATNGAQITDVYSAIYPGTDGPGGPPYGPNQFSTADVLFPFAGVLNSATLTVDMADFQSTGPAVIRGIFTASINGVALPFIFNDGIHNSVVRAFVLTAAQVSAANTAGRVIFTITRPPGAINDDFVAFDFFRLDGDVTVPEPGTLVLFATGCAMVAGAVLRRRRSSRG